MGISRANCCVAGITGNAVGQQSSPSSIIDLRFSSPDTPRAIPKKRKPLAVSDVTNAVADGNILFFHLYFCSFRHD